MVLDIMLPRMSGFEVLKKMREHSDVPVVLLTAKSQSVDKVVGLELGADDYITKPFDTKELLARIKAILRRFGRDGRGREGLLTAGSAGVGPERLHGKPLAGRRWISRPPSSRYSRCSCAVRGRPSRGPRSPRPSPRGRTIWRAVT